MRVRSAAWRTLSVFLFVTASRTAAAQEPPAEGALALLVPTGARAVAMGQAATAQQDGSEAVWWNPAGLARADHREAAIHHSKTIVATGDAVSLVVPASVFGVFALSANILNYGEQEVTDSLGSVGKLLPRDLTYAATYASPIGSRGAAAITYKIFQSRVDCQGSCAGVPAPSGASSALDLGAQVALGLRLPVTIGVVVRNVGPRLQVNDRDQADPLPTRVHVGATAHYAIPSTTAPGWAVTVAGDVVGKPGMDPATRSYRIGTDLAWMRRVHLRGGYAAEPGDAGGPSLGFGITSGSFAVDFARLLTGLSADAGQAPTYLSLRYLF